MLKLHLRRKTAVMVTFFGICMHAEALRFDCRDPMDRQLVRWEVRSKLQQIVAVNSAVRGFVEVDGKDLGSVRGNLEVDSRLFRSTSVGIESYLKDGLFKVAEFPMWNIELDAKKTVVVQKTKLKKNVSPVSLVVAPKLEGALKFLFRGMKQNLVPFITAEYFAKGQGTQARMDGNLLHLNASLLIDLASLDFKMPDGARPEEIKVDFDLTCFDSPLPLDGTFELPVKNAASP